MGWVQRELPLMVRHLRGNFRTLRTQTLFKRKHFYRLVLIDFLYREMLHSFVLFRIRFGCQKADKLIFC